VGIPTQVVPQIEENSDDQLERRHGGRAGEWAQRRNGRHDVDSCPVRDCYAREGRCTRQTQREADREWDEYQDAT
jgi:hypothetical protein